MILCMERIRGKEEWERLMHACVLCCVCLWCVCVWGVFEVCTVSVCYVHTRVCACVCTRVCVFRWCNSSVSLSLPLSLPPSLPPSVRVHACVCLALKRKSLNTLYMPALSLHTHTHRDMAELNKCSHCHAMARQ